MREVCLTQLDYANLMNQEFIDGVHGVAEKTVGRTNGKRKCIQIQGGMRISRRRLTGKESQRCRILYAELNREADVRQEYERARDEYRVQQKQVKFMI